MLKKYFTLQEANQQLPVVRQIVAEIIAKGQALRARLTGREDDMQSPQAQDLADTIETRMAQLEDMGCFYKDWNFEIGLVDFPAMIEGEEVFLCWRSDEGEILWYHGPEDGFAGRRPLPEDWLLRDLFKEQ